MTLYNKAGGKVLPGLERHRKVKQALFDTPVASAVRMTAVIPPETAT